MKHDYLFEFSRIDLDRLNLAAGVLLSEPYVITPTLAAELITFKKRVERALLTPDAATIDADHEWPKFSETGRPAPLVMIDPAEGVRPLDSDDMAKVTAAIATLREYLLLVGDDE